MSDTSPGPASDRGAGAESGAGSRANAQAVRAAAEAAIEQEIRPGTDPSATTESEASGAHWTVDDDIDLEDAPEDVESNDDEPIERAPYGWETGRPTPVIEYQPRPGGMVVRCRTVSEHKVAELGVANVNDNIEAVGAVLLERQPAALRSGSVRAAFGRLEALTAAELANAVREQLGLAPVKTGGGDFMTPYLDYWVSGPFGLVPVRFFTERGARDRAVLQVVAYLERRASADADASAAHAAATAGVHPESVTKRTVPSLEALIASPEAVLQCIGEYWSRRLSLGLARDRLRLLVGVADDRWSGTAGTLALYGGLDGYVAFTGGEDGRAS